MKKAMETNETTNPCVSSYERAMSLFKRGHYAEAADFLEPLSMKASLQGHLVAFYHAQACRKAAEHFLENDDVEQATHYLQRGLKNNPQCADMIRFLADCLLTQGKYHQAGQQLAHLSELHESSPLLQLKEAMSHYLAGKTGPAVDTLHGLVVHYPTNFEINYHLGMILAGEDRPQEAIGFLTVACRLRPENSDARWKLGLAQGLCGHLVEAIRHLHLAHRLDPANNWLLAHLTLAVKQARHQGIQQELQIVKIDQVQNTEAEQALNQLAELIVREPEFVTAFLDLPTCEIDDQIFTELLKIIMRALEGHPEYADLHYHCSCIFHRLDRTDQAIRESQQALEINPRYLNALVHLGKLYIKTNQDDQAIHRLKAAVDAGANFADVHYLLGNLYRKQGSIDNARSHYHRALNLNHHFQAAREALAELAA
jgi:tetratricopeptide (TPR) repeat protein